MEGTSLKVRDLEMKSFSKSSILIAIAFVGVILLFQRINKGSIINELFRAAGFTYGPLLGLFSLGLLTKRKLHDRYVIFICIAAPVISYFLNAYPKQLFNGLSFGFLILAVNGLLTFGGLWMISGIQKAESIGQRA